MENISFEEWWYLYGSEIKPKKDHDMEEHAKRISKICYTFFHCNDFETYQKEVDK